MLTYSLPVKITPYLKRLAKKSQAVKKQFYPSQEEFIRLSFSQKNLGGLKNQDKALDPLNEKKHSPLKGLIHRYPNRLLVLLTLNCAAYCRFCFRRRLGTEIEKGILTESDLDKIVLYLKKHPKVTEVIISGGDPLTVPFLLEKFLAKITKLEQIKIIRIGTRLPVSDPQQINSKMVRILKSVKKQSLYVLLHFEHPDELTPETKKAIKKLRSTGAILLSQSVFLKGINDQVEILARLFEELVALGVKPYYLFHNDEPLGTKHFTVPFKKEIKIMTSLRQRLSGLACPMYVFDDSESKCKIPVPLDFDYSFLRQPKFCSTKFRWVKKTKRY